MSISDETEIRRVFVRGIPVDLMRRMSEHTSDLIREFKLIAALEGSGENEVPARLVQVLANITETMGPHRKQAPDPLEEALAGTEEEVDIEVDVPVFAGPLAETLRRQFELADSYCRTGNVLLTMASEPDVMLVRNWYLREFALQLAGEEPTSWPEYYRANQPVRH